MIDHVVYGSFGTVVSESSPSSGDRFKQAGREYDSQTGIYLYRARYYDPRTGRFAGRDPMCFAGGDQNLYRFVSNEPTDFLDPLGLWQTPPQARPGGGVPIFRPGGGYRNSGPPIYGPGGLLSGAGAGNPNVGPQIFGPGGQLAGAGAAEQKPPVAGDGGPPPIKPGPSPADNEANANAQSKNVNSYEQAFPGWGPFGPRIPMYPSYSPGPKTIDVPTLQKELQANKLITDARYTEAQAKAIEARTKLIKAQIAYLKAWAEYQNLLRALYAAGTGASKPPYNPPQYPKQPSNG